MSDSAYDNALQQLSSPETWCAGAQALTDRGDARAVVPLLRAYETRTEGDKLCLLEAMVSLGAAKQAVLLAGSQRVEDRRMGAHLMELAPDEAHLGPLSTLCEDADAQVRHRALNAIAGQLQTPAWEAALIALLASERFEVREQAVRSLSRRETESARQALQDRLPVETDPDIKSDIEAALRG